VSASTLAAVGLVGGLGAVARFALDGHVAGWGGGDFPFGTLVVNVVGAFALGLLVGAEVDADAYRVLGTGLIGAFTTFSTWMFESHRLTEEGNLRLGLLNFGISLVVGAGAVWAGTHVGSWL
jgi:CrcB protein